MKRQRGFIALVSLLLIAAVTLAIGLSVSSLSIAESQAGLIREQTGKSFQIAEGCVDEAIIQLRRNAAYTGATLSLGDGSCIIRVTGTGTDRLIRVDASVQTYRRLIEASVRVSTVPPTMLFWRESVPSSPAPI